MFKFKLLLLYIILLILTGCTSSRKTFSPSNGAIVVDDGTSAAEPGTTETSVAIHDTTSTSVTDLVTNGTSKSEISTNFTIAKNYSALQNKYAGYLQISPDEIKNVRLYSFIDNWLNTPYLWGGTNKNGIDCSAFVQQLIEYVYQINLPRTSLEQFYTDWIELFISTKYLSEGDLVFFKTLKNDNPVTHIGFYLKNHKFVNSSSKGVSIASLDDPYWKKKFVAAGRIKSSKLISFKK